MSSASTRPRNGVSLVADWMKSRGHKPFPFQRKVWKSVVAGKSGLLHSPTGTGKTMAVWLGAISRWYDESKHSAEEAIQRTRALKRGINRNRAEPVRVVWLTPLRALAADTMAALTEPVDDLGIPWTVERRTSDTSSTLKTRQKNRLPTCLITTPESLSILLSHEKSHQQFGTVQLIVLDEWHELMGSKRGVQAELCLARLRRINPSAVTWALSATIGNVESAMHTALGNNDGVVVRAPSRRKTEINSLVPDTIERFPWAGHMGLKSLDAVANSIDQTNSSLVFTNTRSQAEKWFSALLYARPEWAGRIGVHHGSLDRKARNAVERDLDEGKLKCVVCTSSLDLGVDFFPVDQVLQIGSPKGIARLMQRAGRSGHYPGGVGRLVFVPTHALELIEIAAARKAVKQNRIESRVPLESCLDVLAQHAVTLACSGGFDEAELLKEVRSTRSFAQITDEQWKWVLDFVEKGGESLKAYPDFRRVIKEDGTLKIADARMAKRHRMSIGTISSDSEMLVRFVKGGRLGTIEERFISKLHPGEKFTFAGRTLKLVMVRDMTAWVRRAKGKVTALPRWYGGRMPLSSELSEAVREQLGEASRGRFVGREMRAVKPLLELQSRWSRIPDEHSLLIEMVKTRDGYHTFIFPFEGRLVHEGLAAILAWRISRLKPITFASTINDYGIELLSPTEEPIEEALKSDLFTSLNLVDQIERSMNAAELDRRRFRDIARVAGLVFNGFPGQSKSARQLQGSSDLFFDVFKEYDPGNLLLKQARKEVLDHQLEHARLASAMDRMASCELIVTRPPKPTPLAFPILVDRLRMRLSSEKLADRIARMTSQFEAAADRDVR